VKQHTPELDGVRGIGILMVLAFHTPGANNWTRFGWAGVDLFFVLSGFLITGVLLDGAGRRNRARTFYIRRALRILPLYYVALVVALSVVPLFSRSLEGDAHRLAAHQLWLWTYTANWPIGLQGSDPVAPLPFLVHFWSLAIEEQFYLVWPLVVWFAPRQTATRVAWGVIIGAFACRVALLAFGAPISTRYFLTPCRLDSLAVGALIALWLRAPGENTTVDVTRRMRNAGLGACLVLVVLIVRERPFPYESDLVATVGFSALAWAFGWLVTIAVLRPSRLLRTPALVTAGKYSYGLYVIHPLVITATAARWQALSGTLKGGAVMWIASIALAWSSYNGFEKRFLRLKDRLAPVT
jgi:peptidoglycan/LPS O-acetylase OafA/YrhL